jgi:hypothetical protein
MDALLPLGVAIPLTLKVELLMKSPPAKELEYHWT